ncbi:aminotransferase class V-fold PLP-dependent enzyme [Kitasatospora sp. RB6PN24]|uniref:aminotransferase class V-fold PLP-dependent enzyme n=1 Tax=Kitasatospora humi TaxID=2893891 RepID=UPI001E50587B|nr:aminotransferase class V-fold PLP-dependent enzyme [Kitasatospora humi]MCC9307475.1 aminotransferase class V-fold PLP-dependent enzyme [Kitasatospora humi]
MHTPAPAPIEDAAALFALDPTVAHLNHGSYGAVPIEVSRAQAAFRAEQEADPDGFFWELPGRIAAARTALARLLDADPAGLALLSNVTEAVAVALDSIPFEPGDEILVTDHGYGVVNLAAERRAAECGATVRTVPVPLDAADPAEVVLAALTPRTRAAILDKITSPTAREFVTPTLLRALADRGVVTLVDAAHAPGMLPVAPDVERADFWFGNLHKWAFAPRPTAVLAVAAPWRSQVRPLTYSWEHASGFPGNVEWRGTADYTGWLAAPTALALLERLGVDLVREHNAGLAAYGRRQLVERAGLAELPLSPGVAMAAVRLPAGVAEVEGQVRPLMEAVRDRLGARVAVRPWPGGGVLRVSAQVYNRPEEYRRLADGLAELLK